MFNVFQLLVVFLVVFSFPASESYSGNPLTPALASFACICLVALAGRLFATSLASSFTTRNMIVKELLSHAHEDRERQKAFELSEQLHKSYTKLLGSFRLGLDLFAIVTTYLLFAYFDFANFVTHVLGIPQGLNYAPLLTPYLLMLCANWSAIHRAEGPLRGHRLPAASYIFFHLKLTSFGLIPILVVGVFSWASADLPLFRSFEFLSIASVLLLVIAISALLPPMVRLLLPVRRLDKGELSDRLAAVAKRCAVRVDRIYIWKTSGAMLPTAFFVGVLAPWRYVFITDALLNLLKEDEVDAVFAHELGHAKHHHIWVLLSFLISLTLVNIAIAYLIGGDEMLSSSTLDDEIPLSSLLVLGLPLLGYFYFGFGYLSRRLERQADFFAAKHASPHALSAALNRIGEAAGGIQDKRGWRHFSIRQRIQEVFALWTSKDGSSALLRRWNNERRAAIAALFSIILVSCIAITPLVIDDIRTGVATYAYLRADALRLEAYKHKNQATLAQSLKLYQDAKDAALAYSQWEGAKLKSVFASKELIAKAEYFTSGSLAGFEQFRHFIRATITNKENQKYALLEIDRIEYATIAARDNGITVNTAQRQFLVGFKSHASEIR